MFYNFMKWIYGIQPDSPELIEAKRYNVNSYCPHYVSNIKQKNGDNLTSNELRAEVDKILNRTRKQRTIEEIDQENMNIINGW